MTGVSVFQYNRLNSAAVSSQAFLLATVLSGSRCGMSSGHSDGTQQLLKRSSAHAHNTKTVWFRLGLRPLDVWGVQISAPRTIMVFS